MPHRVAPAEWPRVVNALTATIEPASALEGVSPADPQYNRAVITRGLREFVARDWQAARDHKDTYWADRIARLGPREGLRIADELRRQAILRDPAWPDAALRRADLLAHARLSEFLRRADSARRA